MRTRIVRCQCTHGLIMKRHVTRSTFCARTTVGADVRRCERARDLRQPGHAARDAASLGGSFRDERPTPAARNRPQHPFASDRLAEVGSRAAMVRRSSDAIDNRAHDPVGNRVHAQAAGSADLLRSSASPNKGPRVSLGSRIDSSNARCALIAQSTLCSRSCQKPNQTDDFDLGSIAEVTLGWVDRGSGSACARLGRWLTMTCRRSRRSCVVVVQRRVCVVASRAVRIRL